MKRLLSLLMVLLLCLSLMPLGTLADEARTEKYAVASGIGGTADNKAKRAGSEETREDAEPEEDAIPPETDGAEEIQVYTHTWINPDIDGVVVLREPDAEAPQLDGGEAPAFTDVDSAGAYIRSQYKVRAESIEYSYTFANGFSWDAVQEAVDKALEHTGVPTEGDYILKHLGGNGYSVSVSGNTYTITITPTYYTTADQEAAVDAAVADVLSQLDLGALSTYEKVKAIHDFIVQNAEYDNENLNDQTYTLKYTAYAALINHTAVCQGYALLTYRLMLEEGIDCRIVTGQAGGGGHAWNIVKLGSYYYYLDCTWDDPVFSDPSTKPEDYVRYDYFLKSGFEDHELKEEFTNDEFNSVYPIGPEDYQPGSGGVSINAVNFPDEAFRGIVIEDHDADGDGSLSEDEIVAVTEMNVDYCDIYDLTGIEVFDALQTLYCSNNQLTSLDVSKNPALHYLYCRSNQLTTLDISNNPNLQYLSCESNQLTRLDVSSCPSLVEAVTQGEAVLESSFVSYELKQQMQTPGISAISVLRVDRDVVVTVQEEDYILGDVNGDGEVDNADVMYLARWYSNWDGYTISDLRVADVNGDGDVDNADVMYLARWYSNWAGYTLD